MKLARYLFFPALVFITAAAYYAFSQPPDLAGATMLVFFGGAMTFLMWVLIPTFDHEGNTAPIDPDFELPED
ncbi:MAG TPA: hypothetical protein VJ839_00330 [Candidatus Limnocylindria bacterium]|nr:hypothetical protein [Candidatus Limnocylindria bacterium]